MLNKFFELPTKKGDQSPTERPSGSFISKYLAAHYQKVSAVKKDLKRLPEKDEFFFLQSDNSFNAFTFIPVILENQSASHLYATTYSINKQVINALVELHTSGKIDQITLCISDTMIRRNPVTTDLLAAINKEYANINVLFSWVHAKVCLIETEKAHYVIEGSGNWSENAYYEQYTFANSKGLFDFRMKLLTEVTVRHRMVDGELVKN